MANEFKIKNGLIVSGSTEIEQNLTVHGTFIANNIVSGSSQISFNGITDKPTLVSGSSQIIISGTTGYSTFSSSIDNTISASISSLSASIAVTDLSDDARLDSLESASGSIRTDFNSFTSSYTTVSGSLDSRLDVLEAYSGSQLVPSSSMSFRTLQTDVYCKNVTGVQINKGTVVRIVGATGDNPLIAPASLLTEGDSANTLGIATQDIPNDNFGLVITEGVLVGVNTSGMTAGDLLFLGANGTFTTTPPAAPNHGVRLGEVLRVQQNQGSIYVRIDNGMELNEAHDVTYSSISHGDLLVRSGSVWKNNKTLNGDYTVTGSLTITQNLTVLGSSSITYVTASQLAVSSSIISVNVFEPAERFGGLKVYDSGSSTATASLLWDSEHNHWIYQNVSGANYSGGMLLSGPRNTGSLGDEPGLINGRIVKSIGGDHLDVSIISETGTTITISGDLVANSITGAFDFNGLVNKPTLVSGSSQIDVMSTTNIARLATTGSNIFIGNQTITGSLNVTGSIVPGANNLYDLGSPTNQFRHLYLSSASLYIDGTKVLGSTAQELQITTDTGQSFKILEAGSDTITLQSADGNITLTSSGGGDVIMDPNTGIIALKGTTTLYSGNKIVSSDGNSVQFGNGIAITGSIVSTATPLVSGSSQISFTGLSNIPSGIVSGSSQVLSGTGIWSGSAQLPSGVVSGSSQITLSSTTGFGSYLNQAVLTSSSPTFAGLTNSGSYSQTSISTQPFTLYGDNADTNGLFRIQIDGVSDSFGTGTRTFLGDGGNDIFIGTANSSYTPNNSYIALNHGGEISMGAGSATKHLTISTGGTATFSSTIASLGGAIQTYNQTSGYGVGFYFPGSTTPSIFADNVLRIYQRVEVWGGSGGYYLDVRDSGGTQSVKFDASGGDSYVTNNLAIGGTSASGKLHVFGTVSAANAIVQGSLKTYDGTFNSTGTWHFGAGAFLSENNKFGIYHVPNGKKILIDTSANVNIDGTVNIGYSGSQGAQLYVQANLASYAAYFEQVGGATSSYGGVRISTNSTGVNSLYIDNAGTQIFSVKGSGVSYISNALGIGYSDPQYTLQVNGSIGLRANSQNIKAITGTGWGYSTSTYKVVMLGDTANNVTVSIGYDPSGNSNSAFSGDGREILFRNGASFATPTSGNTAFHLNTLVMKDGKVAVGTADPTGKFHVYSTSASDTYLETGTSGTSGKLIFKTSDNSDLNKYIAQESYYMMFSGNANEGFKWRDSNSNILMALFGSNNAYGSRLGINTTTPAHALDVTGNMRINQSVAYLYFTATTTNRYLAYNGADTYWRADGVHYFEKTSGYKGSWDASGNLTVNGNLTESSALKYKENINNLTYGLDTVLRMRPVSYDKKETGAKEIGFIAEELNELIPEIIKRDENGEIDAVSYGRITAILVEAIKELNNKIK